MKELFLTVLLLLNFSLIVAQTENETESSKLETSIDCIDNIEELEVQYQENKKKYDKIEDEYEKLNKKTKSKDLDSHNEIFDSLKKLNDDFVQLHNDIARISQEVERYRLFCKDIFEKNDYDIDSKFEGYKNFLKPIKKEETKLTTYSYYGDNLVIKDDLFEKESTESKILQQIISEKGEESYLGDIYIPKDEQEFDFYEKLFINKYESADSIKKTEKQFAKFKHENWIIFRFKDKYVYKENNKRKVFKEHKELIKTNKKFKFKKVSIEILDGYFSDIKVQVKTEDGNLHFFENRVGISLLNFASFAKRNYLFYSYSLKSKEPDTSFTDKEMEQYRIKLTDVFNYDYKIGNHYVPNNVALEFPMKIKDENDKLTNADGPAKHEIKANTDLNNVFELRTYTDFLGLFNDSDNGIVQIEGSADFYISPFPLSPGKTEWQIFNKLSPMVRFSRLEEESRFYTPNYDKNDSTELINPIELIEKSYLSMGTDVNVAQLRFRKHFPFTLSAVVPVKYHLTQTKVPDGDSNENISKNIKCISVGAGLELNVKRFQNFGYRHRLSYTHYGYEKYNKSILNIEANFLPKDQWILSNEAEIFYHTNQNPNNAIFLRLKTFNNYNANQSFYQLQFGYKFSVGTTKI